jgi:hypothetical protein
MTHSQYSQIPGHWHHPETAGVVNAYAAEISQREGYPQIPVPTGQSHRWVKAIESSYERRVNYPTLLAHG